MGAVSEYIGRNTILKVLADSEPKEEDWRTDNMEGYDLRKIRFLQQVMCTKKLKMFFPANALLPTSPPLFTGIGYISVVDLQSAVYANG